jgi:hypothetical protein
MEDKSQRDGTTLHWIKSNAKEIEKPTNPTEKLKAFIDSIQCIRKGKTDKSQRDVTTLHWI